MMEEDRGSILTEEQLQRSIEAGQWYESEGESGSEEVEEEDSLLQLFTHEQTPHSQWVAIQWPTDHHEDDPTFMHPQAAEGDRKLETYLVVVLRQLGVATEGTDSGVTEQTSEAAAGHTQYQVEVEHSTEENQPPEMGRSCGLVTMEIQYNAAGGTNKVCPGDPIFDDGIVQLERPKYYYIAQEIMTTERTYVQSLKLLEKVVHGAIKTTQQTGRPILPENGRKEIFLNIGELYALNFDLLQELEDRIEHWDDNPAIADVLAKRAPFFKLYSMYTSRFDEAQMAYCKWMKSCKTFAELIRTIESSRLCKGLPISSYMLCPIQRIPRYRLLLEDYLKHLPEGHSDIESTKAALAAISAAAVHMNERIKDLENQAQVVRIQKTFVGRENIVAPGRKYLGRGPVYLVPGQRSSRKGKQRILFLFSDVLLITKVTKQGRYKIQHKLTLKDLLVSSVQSPQLENAFCVVEKGMTKPFQFYTKTYDERTKWLRELQKAVAEDKDRRQTFSTMTQYAALLNDPETKSSILAVLNDPSFEHREPSWVRRSIRVSHSTKMRPSIILPTGEGDGEQAGSEEVDTGESEVMTEFVSEEEHKQEPHGVFKHGADKSLSSYMNQRSVSGELWRRRWFVLTPRALVCYENHRRDEATGALLLAGYSISVPDPADGITRQNIIKLSYPGKKPYFFQLPSSYDFERWYSVLSELLAWQLTSALDSIVKL